MLIPLLAAVAIFQHTSRAASDTSSYYTGDSFEQIDQRGVSSARIPELCPQTGSPGMNVLADRQDRLAANKDSATSYGLACARALLFAINAPGREGPGISPGESWATGAVAILMLRLQQRPADAATARLLGAIVQDAMPLPLPAYQEFRGMNPLTDHDLPVIAALLYRAVQLGVHDPATLRSCTSLLLDLGDRIGAHDCSLRALELGMDSTWHFSRLAYLAFAASDTAAGMAFFQAAADASRDPASRAELGWHLEPASRSCPRCISEGIVAPAGVGNPLEDAWLSVDERRQWFALAPKEIVPWLQQTVMTRHEQHDVAYRWRIFTEKSSNVNTLLSHASPLVANLIDHYWYTAYAGGGFAPCGRSLDSLSCVPRPIPDDAHHLHVAAELAHVWNPVTGAPLDLLAFGIPKGDIFFPGKDSAARIVLEVHRWSLGKASRDTALMTAAAPSTTRDGTKTFFGLLTLNGAHLAAWSIAASQSSVLRRGGQYQDLLSVEPDSALALSDVVLGDRDHVLLWQSGGKDVLVAANNTFSAQQPMELYYQLRSDKDERGVKVSIAIRRVAPDDSIPAAPLLQVASHFDAHRGINEQQRQLDVSRIAHGTYQLEVAATTARGTTVWRNVSFTLQ